jgi:hypothetical protein
MERKAKDRIHNNIGVIEGILEVLLRWSNLGDIKIQALLP